MKKSLLSLAKSSSQRIQVTTLVKPENTALWAYRYFRTLQQHNNPILTKEYRQLPDDSQFIEKHYHNLKYYRDLICGIGGQYDDIGDISELFLRLSKHIPIKDDRNPFWEKQLDQYNQFITDLVATLRLNGGHLFVLDLLIYNKEVFEHVDQARNVI